MSNYSNKAINLLPFSLEAVNDWCEDCDLLYFLFEILDENFVITDQSGNKTTGNYAHLAPSYFEKGQKYIKQWIVRFAAGVNQYSHMELSNQWKEEDFYSSPQFGRAAKYFISWREMVGNTLADGVFFFQ